MKCIRSIQSLVAFAAIVVLTNNARAQQDTLFPEDVWLTQIGVSVYGSQANHAGSFVLPNLPTCCTEYTTGQGLGVVFGLALRQEITKHVRLVVRGVLAPWSASFQRSESLLLSGQIQGESVHELDASLSLMALEALVDFRLPGNIRLMAGMWGGTWSTAQASQRERLAQPATGTFENGQRVRGESTDVPLVGTSAMPLGIVVGGGWDWHLTQNHSWTLTPEVHYGRPLENIVSTVDWKASMLRAGVTLTYAVNAPKPPLPILFKRETVVDTVYVDIAPDANERYTEGPERVRTDTIYTASDITLLDNVSRTDTAYVPQRPEIIAAIAVKAVEEGSSAKETFGIEVSTQFVTEALPILPVVFFDHRAVGIASRYAKRTGPDGFSVDAIPPRTIDVHREILNIVGFRLRSQPASRVKLVGTTDPTTESADCGLAQQRAEAVRNYFVSIWGIEASRIDVGTGPGCIPERVTRQQSEDGYSENRRVEILTDDLALLQPVARKRFNETKGITPPKLLFDPRGTSQRYIERWELTASTAGTELLKEAGEGLPKSFTRDLSPAQADAMKSGVPVEVALTVFGIRGSGATATTRIAVNKDTLSTEYERLTLTLFDVASDKVSPMAEAQIRAFVNSVQPGATVVVRGFADLLGNAKFNRELSLKRAAAVCNAIRTNIKKRITLLCDEVSSGYPPGIQAYDTPEERFLSRTVQIEVQQRKP